MLLYCILQLHRFVLSISILLYQFAYSKGLHHRACTVAVLVAAAKALLSTSRAPPEVLAVVPAIAFVGDVTETGSGVIGIIVMSFGTNSQTFSA